MENCWYNGLELFEMIDSLTIIEEWQKGIIKGEIESMSFLGIPKESVTKYEIKEVRVKMSERKYKVGDVVRTLVDTDMNGVKLFPKGTIGIIKEIDYEGDMLLYEVADVNEDGWYYSSDMIEPVDDGGKKR